MACLIKTHSLVLSSSQMTSDQRTMRIIIIPLWVVFLLYFSSCFMLFIPILMLLLIGLSRLLTSSFWVFTRSCVTQRSSDCWSSINLSGLTPLFKLQLSTSLSFSFIQLNFSASHICLSSLCLLPPQFHFLPTSTSASHFSGECWKALPKQQSVKAIGYILPSVVKLN